MGDENPICTLGDYSKPSHEGYRNTIELPVGNNMFFPPGRTAKLRNDILMFQQRQDESLYDAWTRFKDLLQKVPHHGLDLWLQVQIFYVYLDYTTQMSIDYAAGGRLIKLRPEVAWETIEDLAHYKEEGWNDPTILEERSLDYKNLDIEQLLGVMEYKVDTLMKDAVSLMGRIEDVFRMTNNEMYQLPPEPSRQEEFEHIVTRRLKEKIIEEGSRMRKIEKITSSREIPSFDEPEPQHLPNFSPLDVNLGDKRGTDPLIKPHSPDSFRMKVIFDEEKLGSS
ncbi:zinc finger, CCHC-type containing protein [Tanacetum coccineum]